MNSGVRDISAVETMLRSQVIDRGVRDQRVLDAMRLVPREIFLPRPDRADAYADRAAPIGFGQTISQPYIVALMTQKLLIEPEHRVLEIGTGSGYQAAVLSHLAREVWTVERIKPLLDLAFGRLHQLGLRNIRYRLGDGTEGWPGAGIFDRILVAAGAPEVPRKLLLSHLADNGVAVIPVGPMDEQMLLQIRRRGDHLEPVDIIPCRFVKLIGAEGWGEEAKDRLTG